MPRARGDNTKFGLPPNPEPWKPFPPEPPWDTPLVDLNGFWLKIVCAAHGTTAYPLRLMAAEQGWDTTLRQIVPKLRCDKCGAVPASITLVSDAAGEAGRAGARVLGHILA
jgi:hypothetical protein